MVSKIFSLAALSGMALASYSNSTGLNATTAGGASTLNATSTTPSGVALAGPTGTGNSNSSALASENAFCAAFSGKINLGYEVGDIIYSIDCGVTHDGIFIDVDISVTLAKRAVPQGLPDCIDNCNAITENAVNDGTASCVATAFNRDTFTCTYYSEVGAATTDSAVDFALVVDVTGTTAAGSDTGALAGSAVPLTTSVVPASTVVNTIYSCASTVTDCPYAAVQTSVVEAYTTVCPGNGAVTTGLAAPVACTSCPYYAKVVTVYTASSGANGAVTSYVPVDTKVINIPTPTATGVSTGLTTTVNTAAAATEATEIASATASGVVAFTGAAQHVEAGMGMAALIGAAALLI